MRKVAAFILGSLLFNCAYAQHDPIQPFKGKIGKTLADTKQAWPEPVKAPAGAPNVIWILIDDAGFGSSSAFGGLIETPNFDKLANNGLRYTNFHNAAICGPTRAALLTGRNHHMVAMGHHPDWAIGAPGYNGNIPFEAATIAEVMRDNGYNTFALGKWHSTVPAQASPVGPFNRWPTGRGFDHFYGFISGATDQWHPTLVEETNQVSIEPNTTHLNQLITDKAINYIANQKSADPDKPFFMYYAPGATHAPAQVSKEWINKYKGKFDKGWDSYREEVFKRQQALGIIPAGTKLPPRQTGLKAWDSLNADQKKVFAHFMEVYAGYMAYTDHEIGRIVDYLAEIGQLDNTAIFLMIGDNGATKEGSYFGRAGTRNGFSAGNDEGEGIDYLLKWNDKLGSESTYPTIPLGWAQAMNVPFKYWKSDANGEGGSHAPLILYYPKGIKEKAGIRTQYSHVIDMLPTTIELTRTKMPDVVNGYKQMPVQGVSFAGSINNAAMPTKHTMQYYEIHGGRAMYKDGWKAEAYHPKVYRQKDSSGVDTRDINFRAPLDFNEDRWELYNLNTDWTETTDLAAKYPEKLKELKALFEQEAVKNQVYPLKDFHAGVPDDVIKPRTILYGQSTARFAVPMGKVPITFTSEIEVNDAKAEGIIFTHGDLFGGAVLYMKNGEVFYTVNKAMKITTLKSSAPLTPGKHSIKVAYSTDGISLSIDGVEAASKAVGNPKTFLGGTADGDGISVGRSMNSPVSDAYKGTFDFTGKVSRVIIDQKGN
ncbi:MAG: arylsulfatase [Sphingobacteriaceae bacterium]|jgi:arylsulfatase|nr:arylsulfatase [Sphingobacteriaceae bacterium]